MSEGGATISDAATSLIFAIKTDVQEPTLSLGVCGSFPHVTGIYTSTLQALADCWSYHLVQAKMLPPTSVTSPLSHVGNGQGMIVQRSANSCMNVSVQRQLLDLPVGRSQVLTLKLQVPNFPSSFSTSLLLLLLRDVV